MIKGRCWHAMVHVEGKVYVFGGEKGNVALGD